MNGITIADLDQAVCQTVTTWPYIRVITGSVSFPMQQLAQDHFISYNMTGCQSHSSSYRCVSISILGPYIQELLKLIME